MHTLRMTLVVSLLLFGMFVQAQSPNEKVQQILAKLDAGESIENMVINLSDINFATGTARLEPVATSYLEQVTSLMEMAPNIDLLIKGHADNTGSDALNDRLSLNRAESVRGFLIQRGIAAERLSVEGLGSSNPVASNATPEGRALNRRVEMEVLKREKAETIQDIIVLRNRQRIGSRVLDYDAGSVQYQQFSSNDTLRLSATQVDTIYFSDGSYTVFEQAEKKEFDLGQWWKENVPIFRESEAFRPRQTVLGLGIGFRNNVEVSRQSNQISIPPAMLIVEHSLLYNLGLGLSAGAMRWSRNEDTGVNYMYYALGLRLAYHFNLGEKLDLYAGGAVTGRMGTVSNGEVTLRDEAIDVGLLLGARYYLNDGIGLFAEIGDESVAYYRTGLTFRFGQ